MAELDSGRGLDSCAFRKRGTERHGVEVAISPRHQRIGRIELLTRLPRLA